MKVSYNWLKQYLSLNLSATEISKHLTSIGLEVEAVEKVESVKGGLKGVVVGQVLTKVQHPNADRLSLTTVDVGKKNPLQIVCGAPNVNVGQKVPVATVGTILYNKTGSLEIKKSKIRGEFSMGMICAEDEMGVGENHEGIMILDDKAKIGTCAAEYFNIEFDIVFEIGLTPNRSDAMGHIGVARDLMAELNHKGAKLQMCIPMVDAFKESNSSKTIKVEVKDSNLCPRYSGVSISGVKVAESPVWLQNKLKAISLSPINNIVDVTNYVLHETGQPLHAFDIAKIQDNKIVVRTLKDKTKFTTLDEIERKLSSNDLMICDARKPLCIAGVFGGIESGISEKTTDVFLESAYFNAVSIRKTAKRHTLSTDASFHFERGCDPNITVYALKRASLLIQDIAGGEIASEITDTYPKKIEHFKVDLNFARMDTLIGEKINRDIVKSILTDLEIEIKEETKGGLSLLVPPFRSDVQREVDVIEEILRIYGYNTVAISPKLNSSITYANKINPEQIRNRISDLLSSNGFYESMNNSITKAKYTKFITGLKTNQNVELLNPLSNDLNTMRQSLLFGALENIAYNNNRQQLDIKFFEFGKTYHKVKGYYKEKQHLFLVSSGRKMNESWNRLNDKVDFFFIKEKVKHVLNSLGIVNTKSEPIILSELSQGLMYTFKKKSLVYFGRVNSKICKAFDVKSEVFIADFNWDLILELVGHNKTHYKPLNKFPKVRRDLSLLIDKNISFAELKKIAISTDNNILKSVNLFDVYEGNKLPKDKKSYALSFFMEDETKTLTDKYIDKVMGKLIKSFKDKVGAEIR